MSVRRFLVAAGLLVAGCSSRSDSPSDDDTSGSTAGGETSGGGGQTGPVLDDSSGSPDPGSTGSGGSESGTTAGEDELCTAWCEQIALCDGRPSPTCAHDCDTILRWRTDNYDAACVMATQARMLCESNADCDRGFTACDPRAMTEYETCAAGTMPQAELQAFCAKQAECAAVDEIVCIVDFLDYAVFDAYRLGCELEYHALVGCFGGLDCATLQDEAQAEAACATEIGALDRACPTFGR